MEYDVYINEKESMKLVMDYISSDKFSSDIQNTVSPTKDFRNGAVWGAAMAMLQIFAYSKKIYIRTDDTEGV